MSSTGIQVLVIFGFAIGVPIIALIVSRFRRKEIVAPPPEVIESQTWTAPASGVASEQDTTWGIGSVSTETSFESYDSYDSGEIGGGDSGGGDSGGGDSGGGDSGGGDSGGGDSGGGDSGGGDSGGGGWND